MWFHVDGLSSAHVYFRLRNVESVSSIPIDDLPPDSVADMLQICKNNSIAGCKLASCKMVYTPHSNLKKTFNMETGAVTYHDTKLCRYARCVKDRQRVRELEKTKSADVDVDYYAELKDNERRIIERKKRARRGKSGASELYDPIEEDLVHGRMKESRQGDASSGLEAGLEALGDISLGSGKTAEVGGRSSDPSSASGPVEPVWVQEEELRKREPSADVRFLRARGYPTAEAVAARRSAKSRIDALRKLYHAADSDAPPGSSAVTVDVPAEVVQARIEEKEVLVAMFGFADDDMEASAKFSDMEDEGVFDVVVPVTGYEAPKRYGAYFPPLMLEVFVDNNIAPLYPNEPPVIAVVGGGLPEAQLRELTKRIRDEAQVRAREDPGEPQIFNLIAFAGEAAEGVVREETAELRAARARLLEAERAAAAAQREEVKGAAPGAPSGAFATEAERRAYAKEVASRAGFGGATCREGRKEKAVGPKHEDTAGISDRQLFDDLFA